MREQELRQHLAGEVPSGGAVAQAPPTADLDLAFLAHQVLSDPQLEHEILTLFLNQSRDVLARMRDEDEAQRSDSAHLLKGSARSIGAFAAAEAAAAFEKAATTERGAAFLNMAEAFARADRAIARRLDRLAKDGHGG